MVELTFLGTGTSTGVPLIQCTCSVCVSKNPKNKRLRASVFIRTKNRQILVDPSIDLRQQAIRAKIDRIDAVLVTHPHADHIGGVDDLRSYNFLQKESIPVFASAWGEDELRRRYQYIFDPQRPIEGGGVARLDLHRLSDGLSQVDVLGVSVGVLPAMHGTQVCLGFKFENLVYLTDCQEIPESTLKAMQNLEVLVLDCLRLKPHTTHLNLDQALALISLLKPEKTYLTHLGHDFDVNVWRRKLPKGVFLAYDGLKVKTTQKERL